MAKLSADDAAARAANPLGRDFSEALARGLSVIAAFGPDSRALTLSDVAKKLNLPRATARRALLTLAQLGYAEEDGRLFRLTPKVLTLASAYLGSSLAATVLQPACEQLSSQHGETFSVAVLEGTDVVMVAYASPRRFYGQAGGVGLRLPAYSTAVGRVLLAGLAPDERAAVLDQIELVPLTPHTVASKAALNQLIDDTAAQGFALAEEEAELGFRSLAVPVRNAAGKIRYALNAGSPIRSLNPDIMSLLPELRAAADLLSGKLV
jgi:IclR family transcriptional regulator, pca regulon regulatory protein